MRRWQFSLRSLMVGTTLAGVACGAFVFIADHQQIMPPTGRGRVVRLGRLSAGLVDWGDDAKGTVFCVRWVRRVDGPGSAALPEVTLVEVP